MIAAILHAVGNGPIVKLFHERATFVIIVVTQVEEHQHRWANYPYGQSTQPAFSISELVRVREFAREARSG